MERQKRKFVLVAYFVKKNEVDYAIEHLFPEASHKKRVTVDGKRMWALYCPAD